MLLVQSCSCPCPGIRIAFPVLRSKCKHADQGIALKQFQPVQFVNSNEVIAKHGLDVAHFDFVGGCVLKNQIIIDQVKNPIHPGVFKQ